MERSREVGWEGGRMNRREESRVPRQGAKEEVRRRERERERG